MDDVLERSTGKDSFIHGESHWQRVAAAGLTLLPETPGADPALVFLFALFHDSMRLNDHYDPEHGPRGAALARELRGEAFDLEDTEMGSLAFACEEHTNGGIGPDPGGDHTGPPIPLDRGGKNRGTHRVGPRLAARAIRLGRVVPGFWTSRRSLVTNRCQRRRQARLDKRHEALRRAHARRR